MYLQTNGELDTTVGRCTKVEDKSDEATTKAEAERVHIKNDMDTVRRDLKFIR